MPKLHYRMILREAMRTPWAILPAKLDEIALFLAAKAAGEDPPQASLPEPEAKDIWTVEPPETGKGGSIAVLPIHGVLVHRADSIRESSGMLSYDRIASWCRKAENDASVSTVLMDYNTPGGTTFGASETAGIIRELREKKRVVGHINALCASAGYHLAAQSTELCCTPSGMQGSVGVYAIFEIIAKALEEMGIEIKEIVSENAPYKREGSPFQEMSEEAEAHFQSIADGYESLMIADIAQGRNVSEKHVRENFGMGRVVLAPDALEANMVDRIERFDQTLARLSRAPGQSSRSGARAEEDEKPAGRRAYAKNIRAAKLRRSRLLNL